MTTTMLTMLLHRQLQCRQSLVGNRSVAETASEQACASPSWHGQWCGRISDK